MKVSKQFRIRKQSEKISGNRKGVALIMVLTVMALATIMILTFFSLATSENRASATYSRGLQAQQVGEQAVNLVIAQIRRATSDPNIAWASQPGAIRTWSRNGDFNMGYKLYSDDLLADPDEASLNAKDFSESQTWDTDANSTEFVDLNEPVIRDEKVYFPVVDPLAKHVPKWPRPIGGDSDRQGIEGFDFNFDEAHKVSPGPDGDTIRGLLSSNMQEYGVSGDIDHLAMPVRWIYQLADGTMGVLRSGRFKAFNSASTPTEDNQIVARFAYWADDESAKLNVNVHAGGLAWDTPRAGGDADMNMGKYQPVQHEWQRYPGHPATVHIAPALAPGVLDIVRNKSAMELIFQVVPRVVGGGSESGTRKADFRDPNERQGLVADKNHLYPSVDEFIMAPNRNQNYFPGPDGRPVPTEELQDTLERLRFFLTATSRAPETTMFNTPKISVWPVHDSDSDNRRTPFDKLIAFCATMGEDKEFFFKRKNADSNSLDYNGIQRNKDLYKYLEKYTDTAIPGVGKSFNDKYGRRERLQILTEIFDYIRCTNLYDDTLYQEDWERAFYIENDNDNRAFTNPRRKNPRRELLWQTGIHKGHGQVTPIQINYNNVLTKGFGRFYTFKEAGLHVICGGRGARPNSNIQEKFTGVKGSEQFPGWNVYGGGREGNIENPGAPSNIPPLHVRPGDIGDPDAFMEREPLGNDYPMWIKSFLDREMADWRTRFSNRMTAPAAWDEVKDVIRPAFVPSNWNYNLLYLLPNYPTLDGAGEYVTKSHEQWMNDNRASLKTIPENQIRLREDQRLLQSAFIFQMFCPSMGWVPINPDFSIEIDLPDGGSAFQFESENGRGKFLSDYNPMGVAISDEDRKWWYSNRRQSAWHDRHAGGVKPMTYFLSSGGGPGRQTPIDPGYEAEDVFNQYHWLTPPFLVDDSEVKFTGGDVTFRIFAGGAENEESVMEPNTPPQLVQELVLQFDDFNCELPDLDGGRPGWINEFGKKEHTPRPAVAMWTLGRQGANYHYTLGGLGGANGVRLGGRIRNINSGTGLFIAGRGNYKSDGPDVLKTVGVLHGDPRITAATATPITPNLVGAVRDLNYVGPHWKYHTTERMAHDMALTTGYRYHGADGDRNATKDRVIIPDQLFAGRVPANPIGEPNKYTSAKVNYYGDYDNAMGLLVDGPYINKPDEGNTHSLFNRTRQDDPNAWELRRDYGDFPYFVRDWIHEAGTPSYFSPNRITNGPGMFGSLPTGVIANFPFRTLLFRPYVRNIGNSFEVEHIGNQDPKDHYLMDLFWMPVVEPYAISDTFSTGGRINLNFQMLPFRHVRRSTAMRGVLRSEFMLMIPTPTGNAARRSIYTTSYKHAAGRGRGYHWRDRPNAGFLQGKRLRSMIMEQRTLDEFQKKFDSGTIFKSASEICEMHLIPQQAAERMGLGSSRNRLETLDDVKIEQMEDGTYWDYHKAVADNGRERPYGNIYQRTTTKSNTFRVYYRGQVIKQSRRDSAGDYSQFDEELDTVVAEYRGSSVIERYIDPNNALIPDYATEDNPPSIGEFYRFRIVNSTRFAP